MSIAEMSICSDPLPNCRGPLTETLGGATWLAYLCPLPMSSNNALRFDPAPSNSARSSLLAPLVDGRIAAVIKEDPEDASSDAAERELETLSAGALVALEQRLSAEERLSAKEAP